MQLRLIYNKKKFSLNKNAFLNSIEKLKQDKSKIYWFCFKKRSEAVFLVLSNPSMNEL